MKRTLFSVMSVLVSFFLLNFSSSVHAQSLTLIKDGKSNYTIVISPDASLSEHHGAQELQMFLEIISGCFVPIKQDNQEVTGPMILVGHSSALNKIDNSINFADLGDEGLVLKTSGDNLILAGGKLRGTMYAVYAFLEDVLGCRWYSAECSYIPKTSTITVNSLNIKQTPAFEYRDLDWYVARDADWSARNRVNSRGAELDPQRGGKVNYLSVHTHYWLMPPLDYYDNHPEYFSILSSRKRTWEFGQFCFTNPEVAKIMAVKTIEWMQRAPEGTIYDVSQNDWHEACSCPRCKSTDDAEGSNAASLIYFVNRVAERTEKAYPEKRIGTLAYTFTQIPPLKARPRKNVVVRFAQIRGCDGHPLTQCEQNVKYKGYIRDWGKMADKVYIWDYVTNYAHYIQPHPVLYGIYKDIQFFHESGIAGVYLESCYESEAEGFEDMQAWVEAKLLWNPDLDLNKLIDEFITGFYGPAAEPMRKYYSLLQNKVLDEWIHFNLYSPPTFGIFTPDVIQKSDALFDEAAELAKNDTKAAYRVEENRLGLRYVKLSLPVKHVIDGEWFKVATDAPGYANLSELENFMETCDKHEVSALSEGGGMLARYNAMRSNVSDHRIITLENPDIKVDVIPSLGGKIFRIIDKKSGKNVLAMGSPDTYGYPASGGYQESPVGIEILDYVLKQEPSGTRIIMDTYLQQDNFQFIREILVPASGAKLEISSTLKAEMRSMRDFESRRRSANDRPMSIRTSPGFAIGPVWRLRAGWADEQGKFDLQPLPEPTEEGTIRKEFWSKNLKTGIWAIYNPDEKIGIIDSFNLDEMDVCTLGSGKERQVISMGLRTKQRPMKAGDTISLHHFYEVVREIPVK